MMKFMDRVSTETAKEIYDSLDDLGVKQHLRGYNYLACAIAIAVKDVRHNLRVVKDIYMVVGEEFNTTRTAVERDMRHCIENIFGTGDMDKIYEYFGNSISTISGRVTVSQFIYTVANYINKKAYLNT